MRWSRDLAFIVILYHIITFKDGGCSSDVSQKETTVDRVQRKLRYHDGQRKTTQTYGQTKQTPKRDLGETTYTVRRKANPKNTESDLTTDEVDSCQIEVQWGKHYFRNQLFKDEPHFVQFKIKQVENEDYTTTNNVFEPFRWSWTYKSESAPLPFISWVLDYGIFSFHLLETKTIYLDHEIELNVSKGCNVTYGSDETLENIVRALVPLVNVSADGDIPTYTESYFCYYQINLANHIINYYFIYNDRIIEYKCAVVYFNYMSKQFHVNTTCACCMRNNHAWKQLGEFPIMFAVLSLLYFAPFIVFGAAQWMAKHEKIIANEVDDEYQIIRDSDKDDDWLYADGINNPLDISDVCSFDRLGLASKYPACIGRLRRLLFVMFVPLFIYSELIAFDQGMGMWKDKITIGSLAKRRVPLGFLSLLGDPENRRYCFAYWLGGPVGVTCLYFALSFLFVVLPRSMKPFVEDGLPSLTITGTFKSPLFLSFYQTTCFSNVINKYDIILSGYQKAIVVMKCRFFMLFSNTFWQYVWTTQTARWSEFLSCPSTGVCILKHVFLPFYLAMCVVEICICLIFYAIPFCSFVTICVKGTTKSLGYLKRQSRVLGILFSFRISFMIVFIVFTLYSYIISIVFTKSLLFICQLVTYCFLAVIIYPSVAFGYLFFFTVMLYYLIGLVRSFSDGYMELLITAVELSHQINTNTEYVYNMDGHLNVLNLRMNQITEILINGKRINVEQDILRALETVDTLKVREKNGVFGIPKVLFHKLVKEFRPVHREVLSLCFKVVVMIVFVAALLRISATIKSGPNKEISEVMHVIFIVVVGALPQLLSSILSKSHDGLLKEIGERRIKDVIIVY